jgi:hypothetical protein
VALMAIHGHTREVEDAYGHALAVFEGNPTFPSCFRSFRGVASVYNYLAELEIGAQVGRQIHLMAEAQDDFVAQ